MARKVKEQEDHELTVARANPLFAECSCGWKYEAQTSGLSMADATMHAAKWHKEHRRLARRAA